MMKIYVDGDDYIIVVKNAKTLSDVVATIAQKYNAIETPIPCVAPPEKEDLSVPDVSDLPILSEGNMQNLPVKEKEEPKAFSHPKLPRRVMREKLKVAYQNPNTKTIIDEVLVEKNIDINKALNSLPDTELANILLKIEEV